jgi:hypothetical protein
VSLSPEIIAQIQSVEAKLAELDPILHRFCSERRFTFRAQVGVWPRRNVWAREEIDRAMDLTMDLTVPEVMERGFYPEMPWSLCATGSVMLPSPAPAKLLSEYIFEHLPFSEVAGLLAARLEEGLAMLRGFTREDIIARGKIHGVETWLGFDSTRPSRIFHLALQLYPV